MLPDEYIESIFGGVNSYLLTYFEKCLACMVVRRAILVAINCDVIVNYINISHL